MAEAGAQIKALGVPGLPPPAQAPWAAALQASFEKGLSAFLGSQTSACLNEWRQALARNPQGKDLLEAYQRKVEEIHAGHLKYHIDHAKSLWEQGEVGRAMSQLRHVVQIDPSSTDARSAYESHKTTADQMIDRYLVDADKWEKMDRLRAAVFCLERAFEIDPSRNGLRQRVTDGKNRLAKLKKLTAAIDKRVI